MKKYSLGVCAVLLAFMLGPPGKLSADTVGLQLNNGGSDVMGGVDVGPYNFTITAGSQSTQVQLICDDAADEVYPTETWQAYTSTFPTLGSVYFPTGPQGQNYEEVAWLVQQMTSPTYSGNPTTVGEIQWAIWDVFDPVLCSNGETGISNCDPWATSSSNLSGYQGGINTWLGQALNSYSQPQGTYSDLVIYTPVSGSQVPVGDGHPQEYFGVSTPQAMPEPMTLWSLLIVLAAIALACKWMDKTDVKSSASASV